MQRKKLDLTLIFNGLMCFDVDTSYDFDFHFSVQNVTKNDFDFCTKPIKGRVFGLDRIL